MSHLGTRLPRALTLLLIALALIGALLVAHPTSAAPAGDKDDDPRAEQAKAVLEKVEDILAGTYGKGSAKPNGPRIEGTDLTIPLRDLFMAKEALTGKDRERADQILARPTGEGYDAGPSWEPRYGTRRVYRTCSTSVCVHYVKSGADAATDWFARRVRETVTAAHNRLTRFGFQGPLKDNGFEGNGKPDIYLGDIAVESVFGYAAPEGKRDNWGWGAWGYLVLENDYREFCPNGCTSNQALRFMMATAAHEYFHLVQFGYDFAEDRWFMEATATWAEDEVFDWINDNVAFLRVSPNILRNPAYPLDHAQANPYGNWIFFRHLSEKYGRIVVRRAWNYASGFTGNGRTPPDHYSVRAVRTAVESMGGHWDYMFTWFADSNRRPRRYYSEAASQNYPVAPKNSQFRVTYADRDRNVWFRLSRLSSATYRFWPATLQRNWHLAITVAGNPRWRGGEAVATVKWNNGALQRVRFWLGPDGLMTKHVWFDRSRVQWVEVTVANTSTRNECWQSSKEDEWGGEQPYDPIWDNTCNGTSMDNNRPQRISVKAVRP